MDSLQNVSRFLIELGTRYGDKQAIVINKKSLTYQELILAVQTHAYVLQQLGVKPQQTVLIMCDNHMEHVLIWLGLLYLGAVTVPLNVHLRGEGLAYITNHSEAHLAFVDEKYLPYLEAAKPDLQMVIIGKSQHHASYDSLFTAENPIATFATPTVAPDQCASILYTSGTTGLPKGVMLSHHAYLNEAAFFQQMVSATSDDTLFTSLPLFHINAQGTTLLGGLLSGATVVISPKFSASTFFDELRDTKATVFNSLGAMIPILLKQPESDKDREHNVRVTACAATPKDAWLLFEKRFGIRIVEGYGLTETTGFCVMNTLNSGKIGSIGQAMDFVEVRVADGQGRPLPPHQPGEICIRAKSADTIMSGYFKSPDKTDQAMAGGWFHSGDLGYMDEDGYLYFSDRIKQCIRRRGENISSWEVENVINQHPKVLESCAVGVPSELGEEDVKIVVVRRDGSLNPEELLDFCQGKMAYFMIPRYVEFRDELPKTATERIQKYKLKEAGNEQLWDREKVGYVVRMER